MKEKEWRTKWSAVGFCDWCRSRRIPQMSQSPRIRSLAASRCGGDLVAMGMRQTVLSALRLSGATDGRRDRQTDTVSGTWHVLPLSSTQPGAAHHLGHLLITRPVQSAVFGSAHAGEPTGGDESRRVFKGRRNSSNFGKERETKNKLRPVVRPRRSRVCPAPLRHFGR